MNREDLIANPSSQNWHEELHLVIEGLRAADVERIGSVEEYVERLLFDTSAHSQSEDFFAEALNDIVTAWQPDRSSRPYRIRALLQLISAYTPPAGRDKICDFIESWIERKDLEKPEDEWRLRRLSLNAIVRYFKVAPPNHEHSEPFKRYVRLLRRLLDHETFAAHAVARLIEVSAMDFSETGIVERLGQPDFLSRLVEYFRPTLLANAANDALKTIFALCVSAGKESVQNLVIAFDKEGIPAILDERGLSLFPRDGQRVELTLVGTILEEYTVMRWQSTVFAEDWLQKLEE